MTDIHDPGTFRVFFQGEELTNFATDSLVQVLVAPDPLATAEATFEHSFRVWATLALQARSPMVSLSDAIAEVIGVGEKATLQVAAETSVLIKKLRGATGR